MRCGLGSLSWSPGRRKGPRSGSGSGSGSEVRAGKGDGRWGGRDGPEREWQGRVRRLTGAGGVQGGKHRHGVSVSINDRQELRRLCRGNGAAEQGADTRRVMTQRLVAPACPD